MKIQLQSILMPSNDICSVAELYFHQNGVKIDFDGYFNLFQIAKRKKYTNLHGMRLSVFLKGYERMVLFHNRDVIRTIPLESKVGKEYLVPFPYEEYDDGVFWFALQEDTEEKLHEVRGFYVGEIDENDCRNVNIGIDICTYRREAYIIRNLFMLRQRLLENTSLDVSGHISIYVVDNGNTLIDNLEIQDIVGSSNGKIKVYPNLNSGGSGGFTRGMMEAMREKEQMDLTHVLLMDDDAVVEPDTLVRMFGLLSTLKEEWKNITIGGAMMREDYPHILFCAGEEWKKGEVVNPVKNLDVRSYEAASSKYLAEPGHEKEWYSGWWCCCYSLETVREDNLPLPLFIHFDDAEFCLRNCDAGIVFLNGAGVWHRGTELNFPGSNLYYDIRNALILITLYEEKDRRKTALKKALKAVTVAAIQMKDQEVDLVVRGISDFLRGPEWLVKQNPESLNYEIRSMAYHPLEMSELNERLAGEERIQVEIQRKALEERLGIDMIIGHDKREYKPKMHFYLTFNGRLLPHDGQGIKLLTSVDSPWRAYRKNKIVWYEIGTGRGILVERSLGQMVKYLAAYWKVIRMFGKCYNTAEREYHKTFAKITNIESWNKILN